MEAAILVTGGAGYVGSHTVYRLLEAERRVVILDDLSLGHREVVTLFSRVYGPEQVAFEEVNLLDLDALKAVFDRHDISGIIDFAAKSLVAESQERPGAYFDANVLAFRNLVAAAGGIPVVKSSTAATYGEPADREIPLKEDYQARCVQAGRFEQSQLMPAAVDWQTLIDWYGEKVAAADPDLALAKADLLRLKIPTNVYGITKAMDEIILSRRAAAGKGTYVSLRYFNVAGAHRSRLIGEDHDPETHLIPLVLQVALGKRAFITVFGEDYPTTDGTNVRDYISAEELADAHLLCLDRLLEGGESRTYNLGTSSGYSVREIIETARKVTGHPIPETAGPRRSGDPATLIADAGRIKEELGWEARASLEDIVASAWHWHRLNPEGYRVAQEERFNPFWGRWVNIAAHRGARPWRGETQALDGAESRSYDPECYLCPGNRRAQGDVNPDYTGVWSFPNDFATLTTDAYEIDAQAGPYRARTSRGVCEVINFGPDHAARLSTMGVQEIAQVVDGWAEIYARLGAREEIAYPLIFENRGEIMGNSQPHPHGQVYAYGQIPDLMVTHQIEMFRRYRETHGGGCFVCDANRVETADARRVIVENERFVGYVPFAAQFPYDVTLVPLVHVGSLTELDGEARQALAAALQAVLRGLDALFGVPYHYSLALIQAPTDGVDYGYHMQVHITSLLRGPGLRKHVVGADIFGRLINPSDPNHTAAEIRQAMRKAGIQET